MQQVIYYHRASYMMCKYFGSLEDFCFLIFMTISFSQGITEIWRDHFSHLAILISEATDFMNLFESFFHFWKLLLLGKKNICKTDITPCILI